jgi:hypothetical protein
VIFDLRAPFDRDKAMLMMPQLIRPQTLFVNETSLRLYVRDLREPAHSHSVHKLDAILDDLPFVHGLIVPV